MIPAAQDSAWPRWLGGHAAQDYNLREVGPGLFVGNMSAITSCLIRPRGWIELAGPDVWRASALQGRRHDDIAEAMRGRVVRHGLADLCPIPLDVLNEALGLWRRVAPEGPLLVSCAAGLSRSASVAAALLAADGLTFEAAVRRVSSRDGEWPTKNRAGLASVRRWLEDRARAEAASRRQP